MKGFSLRITPIADRERELDARHRHEPLTYADDQIDSSIRIAHPPLSNPHAVATPVAMYTCTHPEVLMDLNRGTLAKIERGLLARLGDAERYQTARIPASDALWSAWRRYCSALGVSMGRGIVALIVHELKATVTARDDGQVLAPDLEGRLLARAGELDARERRLEERERQVKEAERLLRFRTMPMTSVGPDVGRNDPCPCGSGSKYKRCHGGWPR